MDLVQVNFQWSNFVKEVMKLKTLYYQTNAQYIIYKYI
jgi:hypothetical protein